MKEQIIGALRELLDIHSFSEELMIIAMQALGEPAADWQLYFVDLKDVVGQFLRHIDEEMLSQLKKLPNQENSTSKKIKQALMIRFTILKRHEIKAIAKFLARPEATDLAIKSLYRTVDTIWYWAGDNATDFNFYTKRLILASIYSATIAYIILKERDQEALSLFLDKELKLVGKINQAKNNLYEFKNGIKKFIDYGGC